MSDKYEIGDLIEKGSFSEVYKFINKKIHISRLAKYFLLKISKSQNIFQKKKF